MPYRRPEHSSGHMFSGLLPRAASSGVDGIAARPPSTWLECSVACVTGGPVAVPPLTSPLIEHWCGTTEPRNAFVPVHPFLYGILPDQEGTPLVSVAFRLEMDTLATAQPDLEDDEQQGEANEAQVREILRRFPPQRAEFHFVSLNNAREWFSSAQGRTVPVAVFGGEEWSVTWGCNDGALRPGTMLVLPTLAHGTSLCSARRKILASRIFRPTLIRRAARLFL